jgi:hypothetical protein
MKGRDLLSTKERVSSWQGKVKTSKANQVLEKSRNDLRPSFKGQMVLAVGNATVEPLPVPNSNKPSFCLDF